MPILIITLLALVVLSVLFLLDRAALWAEQRGWIYWRKTKPTGNPLGSITLELQKVFESGKATHVIEAKHDQKKEAPDPGADGP